MNKFQLRIEFKGDRNYVHGTTMLDESYRLLSEAGYISLSNLEFLIRRMVSTNLQLVFAPHSHAASDSDDVAVLRFFANGKTKQVFVRLDEGRSDVRVTYDESEIIRCCDLDAGTSSIRLLRNVVGFSQIEILISMNKFLHLALLDKPAETNWVFCRWVSPIWPLPIDISGVSVVLKQTLGSRLTQADVELDGQILGQIYFSAKGMS